jgi:hypothetical protein
MSDISGRDKLIAVIECKKTRKEIFTFLFPSDAAAAVRKVERVRCLFASQIPDSTLRSEVFYGEWTVSPESLESNFCVVSGGSGGKRLLEPDAQFLVQGAEAYARFACNHLRQKSAGTPDWVFVPVIVTNAPLFAATYDPRSVSMTTGELPLPQELKPLKCVRFRKPFIAMDDVSLGERTVLVVNADSLDEFLPPFGGVIERSARPLGPPIPPRRR